MISLASQMLAFLVMMGTGVLVGFMFDVYRVIRTLTRPRFKGSIIMDLLFWIGVTPIIFLMLLMSNWGELRLYLFLGIACGLFIYFQLFSAKVLWALLALTRWSGSLIVKTVRFIVQLLSMPSQLIGYLAQIYWHRQLHRGGWYHPGGFFRLGSWLHQILPWGKAWPFGRR